MRIATVQIDGQDRIGTITVEGGFVDVTGAVPYADLRAAIEAGDLAAIGKAAEGRTATHAPGEFTYRIPVPNPEKTMGQKISKDFPGGVP